MNTQTLTDKQVANRAYYARHAEQIKAKKREQYKKSKAGKVMKVCKRSKPKMATEPKTRPRQQKPQSPVIASARQKIENYRIMKDLEIDSDFYG